MILASVMAVPAAYEPGQFLQDATVPLNIFLLIRNALYYCHLVSFPDLRSGDSYSMSKEDVR